MSNSSDPPSAPGFMRWFESRLPLFGFVRSAFLAFPTPRNLNYWWTFGGILTFLLAVQIVTGVALAMHYTPDTSLAFASVQHIMRDVDNGWLIRDIHATGTSMVFIAVYAHIARGLYYGSYRAPREVMWIFGLILFLLMMATAFMGYVLPWDQMGFWGAKVVTSLVSAVPVVGDRLTLWLWGGYSVGDPTLHRLFALHYLLPFTMVAVVVLHIWALHVPGSNNPTGVEVKSRKDTLPFHPYFTIKDLLALASLLTIFAYLVFEVPDYFGNPQAFIEANPLVTPAHIVPEWYFLPFYAMLRAVPSKLGGAMALFGSILVLAFLPWLDGAPVRSARFRPVYRAFLLILFADVLALGWCGSQEPVGAVVPASELLTAWYFVHWLVLLPWLGRVEKPRPLPGSISDAVLGRNAVA